jgi:hypothetical protein
MAQIPYCVVFVRMLIEAGKYSSLERSPATAALLAFTFSVLLAVKILLGISRSFFANYILDAPLDSFTLDEADDEGIEAAFADAGGDVNSSTMSDSGSVVGSVAGSVLGDSAHGSVTDGLGDLPASQPGSPGLKALSPNSKKTHKERLDRQSLVDLSLLDHVVLDEDDVIA